MAIFQNQNFATLVDQAHKAVGASEQGVLIKEIRAKPTSFDEKVSPRSTSTFRYAFNGSLGNSSKFKDDSLIEKGFSMLTIYKASLPVGVVPSLGDSAEIAGRTVELTKEISIDEAEIAYCFKCRVSSDTVSGALPNSNVIPLPSNFDREVNRLIRLCLPECIPPLNEGNPGEVIGINADGDGFVYLVNQGTGMGGGGITLSQVNDRIRTLVDATALDGNMDRWAKGKLPSDTVYSNITDGLNSRLGTAEGNITSNTQAISTISSRVTVNETNIADHENRITQNEFDIARRTTQDTVNNLINIQVPPETRLPSPQDGDAGKFAVVNFSENGYELIGGINDVTSHELYSVPQILGNVENFIPNIGFTDGTITNRSTTLPTSGNEFTWREITFSSNKIGGNQYRQLPWPAEVDNEIFDISTSEDAIHSI